MKNIFVAKSKTDLERCFSVMHELRPHLNLEEYLSIYEQAHKHDGYEIVFIEQNGSVVAVMGYRFLFDFVRGKHVYIDDLVTSEKVRSLGLGAKLLKYAEEIARHSNCAGLRLCTGIDNHRGVQFYEKHGWQKRAFAYSKKLTSA